MDKIIVWTFDDLELEKRMTGPVNQTLNLVNTEFGVNLTHIPNQLISNEENNNLITTIITTTISPTYNPIMRRCVVLAC